MPYPTTPATAAANLRPVTEYEHTRTMIAELFQRCEPGELLIHMAMIRKLRDDNSAVLTYCYQELTAIDERGQRQDERELRMG